VTGIYPEQIEYIRNMIALPSKADRRRFPSRLASVSKRNIFPEHIDSISVRSLVQNCDVTINMSGHFTVVTPMAVRLDRDTEAGIVCLELMNLAQQDLLSEDQLEITCERLRHRKSATYRLLQTSPGLCNLQRVRNFFAWTCAAKRWDPGAYCGPPEYSRDADQPKYKAAVLSRADGLSAISASEAISVAFGVRQTRHERRFRECLAGRTLLHPDHLDRRNTTS